MLNVIIDKHTYYLPSNYLEYPVHKGLQVQQIKDGYEDWLNNIQCQKIILAILLDCDESIIEMVTDEQIKFLFANINYLNDSIGIKPPLTLCIKGKCYQHIGFVDLNVQDYYQLEYLINNNFYNSFTKILGLLYKQNNKHSVYIFLNRIKSIFKPYVLSYRKNKTNTDTRVIDTNDNDLNLFNKLNYVMANSIIMDYLQHRNTYLKQYGLTIENSADSEYMNDVDDSYFSTNNDNNSVGSTWGVYHILMLICNNDINQINTWLEKNVLELYTRLKYGLDVQREKEILMRKNSQ